MTPSPSPEHGPVTKDPLPPVSETLQSSPNRQGSITFESTADPKHSTLSVSQQRSTHESRLPNGQSNRTKSQSPHPGFRDDSRAALDFQNGEPRQIILRSFAPRVAIYASQDTEDLVENKGLGEGFCGLLKPFGENIQGKVIIRDSVGASRGCDEFAIRFVNFEWKLRGWKSPSIESRSAANVSRLGKEPTDSAGQSQSLLSLETILESVDSITDHFLQSYDTTPASAIIQEPFPVEAQLQYPSTVSRAYLLYLRKLLASELQVPYETFSQPVACLIAVSSRNKKPLETLRNLYAATRSEGDVYPEWVGVEYLRYYVLVHDEDQDDIVKSTALFDLMKRHFGLHCHLLRLRSAQCVESDDDSSPVPSSEWLTPEEDLSQIEVQERSNGEILEPFIFDSDATAIKSLVRELVTQSVVPFMESRVMAWNDQVASRRRGLSGRFMSLSKRFTGFGSVKGTTASSATNAASSASNFDFQRGFYPPGTAEATMRQLADYAMMLRDWKLAYSTYELVRSDFGNDKAWIYHASATEMAAISLLLTPQASISRSNSESIRQLLETAMYSYLTRCSFPSGVVRTLILAMELLAVRGPGAVEDAARWANRLLELDILSPLAQAFISERISDGYKARRGNGSLALGSRQRKSAFWSILAAKRWASLGRFGQARARCNEAYTTYATTPSPLVANKQIIITSGSDQAIDDFGDGILASENNEEGGDETTRNESSEQLNDPRPTLFSHANELSGFTAIDAGHLNTDRVRE